MKSILMTKEFWLNSQFSVAKYSGGIGITDKDGEHHDYYILNKKGSTAWTSLPADEPADLVDKQFIPYYAKLGRDKFIAILEANNRASRADLKDIFKAEVEKLKAEKQAAKAKAEEERRNPSLFPDK